MKQKYGSIFLRNSGSGTASTIDVDVKFINAHEFHDFNFNTKDKEIDTPLSEFHWIVPEYVLQISRIVNEGSPDLIRMIGEDFLEKQNPLRKVNTIFPINWNKNKRIGSQEKGDELLIHLPISYRTLAHQFFLERVMIRNEKAWITPNPRLRIRVTYTEEILEHMNDHEEARRLKEFEISCCDDVQVISAQEKSRFGSIFLLCDFNIQTIFDRPLHVAMPEELKGKEKNLTV